MSTAGLVVVGAGLAGVRAVEGARRSGFTGPVTLLGSETDAPYDRPPLSKAFLTESAALKYLRTAESLRDELDVEPPARRDRHRAGPGREDRDGRC